MFSSPIIDGLLAAAFDAADIDMQDRAKLQATADDPPPGSISADEFVGADEAKTTLLLGFLAISRAHELEQAARALLARAAALEADLSTYDRGRLWHLRGFAAWRYDRDTSAAHRYLTRSLDLLEPLAEPVARAYMARCWASLGQVLQSDGLYDDALKAYERSLDLRDPDDVAGTALTLGNLGRGAMELGDFARAQDYFQRDLEIVSTHLPDRSRLLTQLNSHLGHCALELGDLDAAAAHYRNSARLAKADHDTVSQVFAAMGEVRIGLKMQPPDMKAARAALAHGTALRDAAPDVFAANAYLNGLLAQGRADIALAAGDAADAVVQYQAAIDAYGGLDAIVPIERATLLDRLADAKIAAGDAFGGALHLREALTHLDATKLDSLREKIESELRDAFPEVWLMHSAGRFVGQGQIDILLEQAGRSGFQGRTEDAVILFSDIRGFTSISEGMDPAELIISLNDYLTHMSRCVEHYGGIIDKFIGDAVMAIYLPRDDHETAAETGVRSALMMLTELDRFNRFIPDGLAPWAIGIGLHCGPVVTGLIGSPQKRSYTVIGDVVNTASRLEGMSKLFAARLLISGEVEAQLSADRVITRPLGRYQVKGRESALEVLEVLGEDDGSVIAQHYRAEAEDCAEALGLFESQDFRSAKAAFEDLGRQPGRMAGYAYLIEQCGRFTDQPPGAGWDGAIRLTEK